MAESNRVRIAAVGDLHYGSPAQDDLPNIAGLAAGCDVLVLCGDLTDRGLPEEAHALAKALSGISVPIVAVLGNHDFESGHQAEVRQILADSGVRMLDGESCVIKGVGFAGAKGFAGGFGRRTLEPWGELAVKQFVQEAMDETMKLESALARLRTPQTIAVLHYAPLQATVEGEPVEIFAFLGCSRLEEPLNRYPVTAAVHGHAHRGTPEGRTQSGVPVYNVSLPLMKKTVTDGPPVRVLELDVEAS